MLVVTANWALADGTVHVGPPPGAVTNFFRELRRVAWRAGFRHDGRYRPLDSVQIVLAGDTFDGLSSLAWRDSLRPWHGGGRVQTVVEKIATAATRRSARFLAGLARLQRAGISVPRADRQGRPLPGTTCQAAVTVVCLIGDRDRMLDGPWLANLAGRYGIHVGHEWSSDTVVVRHGSEFDPLGGCPDDFPGSRSPTLAESLAIDLLVNFAWRLLDQGVPRPTAAAITRRLTAAAPLELPRCIATCPEPAIREAWCRSVHYWHSQASATVPEAAVEHAVVDALAVWLEPGDEEDRHRHSRDLAAVIAHLRPRVARRSADSRLFVLGHPPGIMSRESPSEGGGCVCLGPSLRHGQRLLGSEPMPATIAFPVAGSHRCSWLADGQSAVDRFRPVHVTTRGAREDEPGIIDAA